jgi:hypothetical protein
MRIRLDIVILVILLHQRENFVVKDLDFFFFNCSLCTMNNFTFL